MKRYSSVAQACVAAEEPAQPADEQASGQGCVLLEEADVVAFTEALRLRSGGKVCSVNAERVSVSTSSGESWEGVVGVFDLAGALAERAYIWWPKPKARTPKIVFHLPSIRSPSEAVRIGLRGARRDWDPHRPKRSRKRQTWPPQKLA